MTSRPNELPSVDEVIALAGKTTLRPWCWRQSDELRQAPTNGLYGSLILKMDEDLDFSTEFDRDYIEMACNVAVPFAQRIKRLEAALEKIDGGDPLTDGYWLSAHQMAEIAREALKECQT